MGHTVQNCCSYAHHLETGVLHFNDLPFDVRQKIIADCGQVLAEAGINFIEETGELVEMEAQTIRELLEDIRELEKLGEVIDSQAHSAHPHPGS